MGREGKFSGKTDSKRRVRSNDNGSDDSDEDYVVSDEEEEESEGDLEEYCGSLDGDASEESFGSLVEEEEDEVEKMERRLRKVERPKVKKGPVGNGKIGGKKSRKRNRVSYDDEEEEEDADYEVEEERRKRKVGRPKSKRVSSGNRENGRITSGKRNRVSYEKEVEEDGDDWVEDEAEEEWRRKENAGRPRKEDSLLDEETGGLALGNRNKVTSDQEEEDGDCEEEYKVEEEDEDEDDDDEEFTPEEDVSLDEEEEEELLAGNKKKNNLKVGRRSGQKRSVEGRKRRSKSSVSKKPSRKKGRKRLGQKRKKRSIEDDDDDGDFLDAGKVVRKKTKKKSSKRRRRYIVPSDSDFVSSGASDYDYTISEEEREQVREASKLCERLRTSSRCLSSSKKIQDTEDNHQLRKPPAKKGKEKVDAAKSEMVKQVCGICLSEEDKRRLRGTLDCCSHYFCFTCIMEWSKVESRCPLCKQRFKTISKPARSTPGVDLREVMIQVPERDQVYQPTEEELRSYLDPYENVICTECHQGGDDGLMLLCDLCDSSAHTYCVGLGREVPEGNWYCEGCRPVALGSSTPQAPSPSLDQRTTNNLFNRPPPFLNSGDFIDPTLLSSPSTPLYHGLGNLPSPRFPNGDIQAASPSGAGAPTLSRRRSLHRHIQNLLSLNRLSSLAGNSRPGGSSVGHSTNGFFTPQIDRSREIAVQPTRMQEIGTPLYTIFEERQRDNNPSSSAHARDLLSSRSDHMRREAVQNPINTSSVNLTLWPELAGIGPMSGYEQVHQHSITPNTAAVFRVAAEGDFSIAREQLQVMVKTHLKNLSRQINLGQATFNEIATCSIHTILAACGLEHRSSEVHVVPPPVTCSHAGMVAAGQISSLMKGCCSSCFDSFVTDVVKMIMDTRLPQWLSLGL